MSYIATRAFKVKGFDGTYRNVKPGDPVPEFEGAKDVKAYVERRWVCRAEDYEAAKAGGVPRYYAATQELPPRPTEPSQPEATKKTKKEKAAEKRAAKSAKDKAEREAKEREATVFATETPSEPDSEPSIDTEAPEASDALSPSTETDEETPFPSSSTPRPGNR